MNATPEPEGELVEAAPPIPVGLSTKVGLIVSVVLGLIAGVTAVLNGDHSEATITTLVGGVVTLITVLGGRYAQATAQQIAVAKAPSEERWDEPVPGEEQLAELLPGERAPEPEAGNGPVGEGR